MTDNMIIAALLLAVRGYAVFPCVPRGKQPITAHGCKSATTNAKTIRRWWERELEANIGIATGAVSGVFVLDVDPDHGGAESLAELEAAFGQLPPTVVSLTGGGGQHLLFKYPAGMSRHPKGRRVRNLVGFRAGLDIRGDGGYILAPPSVHPNGRRYQWAAGVERADVAGAPEWLLEIVCEREREREAGEAVEGGAFPVASPKGTTGGQIRPRSPRYVAAAIRSACKRIASAVPGTRNSTLNTEAFGIGQLVGAGALDLRDATAALARAAFECGLDGQEIERTLQSGLSAGMAQPREAMDAVINQSAASDDPKKTLVSKMLTNNHPNPAIVELRLGVTTEIDHAY